MIITLLGKAGVGKTTIANTLYSYNNHYIIIDEDEIRSITNNKDQELGLKLARIISDLGYTVILAIQAPIRKSREKYLSDNDIQILITNSGDNIKEKLGYNDSFKADYSNVNHMYEFVDFTPEHFENMFIPVCRRGQLN